MALVGWHGGGAGAAWEGEHSHVCITGAPGSELQLAAFLLSLTQTDCVRAREHGRHLS